MLERARARLVGETLPSELVVADFATEPLGGPYDAVVSALAIHHLTHPAKRRLFARIHASLHPGGRFINADQVRGPTDAREQAYQVAWLGAVRRAGVAEEALAAARERMRHDITAPLEDQLRWLRRAGFTDVDCEYKSGMFGVFFARRPDG
jgi:tRNA (cmo5U34)-methyltransferase